MNTFVKEVKQREVVIQLKGSNELQSLPCSMVVWATGIKARPLTNKIREIIGLNIQSNRMGLLTDGYLRVKGVDDGSIFSLGDCATMQQPKLVDRIQLLFEEADVQHRGSLDLQQFQSLVERKITEFPQVFQWLSNYKHLPCFFFLLILFILSHLDSNLDSVFICSLKYFPSKLKKHLQKLIKKNLVI